MTNQLNIGIIGGAGYTGGELLRILLQHPSVNIVFVHSKSQAGKPVYNTHHDLLGETELTFTDRLDIPADVLFLCMGHGESKVFLSENQFSPDVKIIDLSQDFRDESNGFVYGLPELQREKIKRAHKIANPGCFATCIELALLPLAKEKQLNEAVHISAITGSTGAGQSLNATSHYSWRNGNISVYKAFTHQHLKEIRMSLGKLQTSYSGKINFIPYRGSFTRGIFASCYTTTDLTLSQAQELYKDYYKNHPFTHISSDPVDVKRVVNTNKCFLYLEKVEDQLLITSVIDNLTKGASGQAVQNMNLITGIPETAGLALKPVFF
ncbi:N-acetyl-gamma-glutamyl-phosphate reductase [Rhodocytophaga rosea]|uniref:N-acetyl-gamma-glutamyl-phosphate reductase n=1 Tax=Rhodocytophaga rosea TaxID=2704465 RepID=A0A6C0GS66_9BACT|nr:N-acetyl-gamma-glutamyl-phosphate reductase [Rhodocytophaga rosea]QHT70941.1 N-acetyl-gamma-glutamyl-phosphate reductase [Rhodocytophaga rosea]